MSLHTLDPGNDTGWALFEGDLLLDAGVLLFGEVRRELRVYSGDTVLIEMPRHYPHRSKGDVNDLLDLACRVGELKAWAEHQMARVELVWPRTWKGAAPKDVHNQRVLAALKDFELKLLSKSPRSQKYDHNCVDAVGLGLWKLGRLR